LTWLLLLLLVPTLKFTNGFKAKTTLILVLDATVAANFQLLGGDTVVKIALKPLDLIYAGIATIEAFPQIRIQRQSSADSISNITKNMKWSCVDPG
jgi:hypothetical protein